MTYRITWFTISDSLYLSTALNSLTVNWNDITWLNESSQLISYLSVKTQQPYTLSNKSNGQNCIQSKQAFCWLLPPYMQDANKNKSVARWTLSWNIFVPNVSKSFTRLAFINHTNINLSEMTRSEIQSMIVASLQPAIDRLISRVQEIY